MASTRPESDTVRRRTLLQALGAGTVTGLAGCQGGGEETTDSSQDETDSDNGGGQQDQNDLGERVPTLTFEYWPNVGGRAHEQIMPVLTGNIEDRLGVDIEIRGVDFLTGFDASVVADQRQCNFYLGYHGLSPDRLDPDELTTRYCVDWAGESNLSSSNHYANCEYTNPAHQQAQAASEEERQELVNEAHSIMSADYGTITVVRNSAFGAARTDLIELNSTGDAGIYFKNTRPLIDSVPQGDNNRLISAVDDQSVQSLNMLNVANTWNDAWNRLLHSSLIEYNQNYELENILAESYETSNEGQQITVVLKDDIEFHNGDPITSEDVKFTFEHLWNNAGVYPYVNSVDYESIEVVDEKTTQFNFAEPFLPLITRVWPKWGIFHKESWIDGGADENPQEFNPDSLIASGPFQLVSFTQAEHMLMEPAPSHPVFSPEHEVLLTGHREEQSKVNAFEAGECHFIGRISGNTVERLEDSMGDQIETTAARGFTPQYIYPMCQFGATKFSEFRHALGAAIDRRQCNELGWLGQSEIELKSCPLTGSHPWRPPEDMLTAFTDSPTGSEEDARQALSEAGWGWDDNGNLHYPPDADLSPRWPKGERPDPSEFSCINEDYEWTGA